MSLHDLAYLQVPDWVFAVLALLGLLAVLRFALSYGLGSRWYSTVYGIMFMGITLSVLTLLALIFCTFFFQEYAFRWLARIVVYASVPVAFTYARQLLRKARREGRRDILVPVATEPTPDAE